MKLNLPRAYLSYSALSLWKKDKEKFRRRYYQNIKEKDTVFTLFGREVHEEIAKNPAYDFIRLPKSEHEIRVTVAGVPIMGYLDTFNPNTGLFGEYKTGIRTKSGDARWTQIEVEKHEQMPFYSLLIWETYGIKSNRPFLAWFETSADAKVQRIGGVEIHSEQKLKLTGVYEIFWRKLYEYDRSRIKRWISASAEEISEDHLRWQEKTKK